ncbi:phosphopantetheine-binding protein [Crossiella sp. SN42]|uniref:acyl carrier protein n=1 Tax=unclassified Crossiella TaxID=2620835 RepID=UPI00207C501D|nr:MULTISPECIES: phosphopantetheine-binding protein [unclassified Crossiella]MCO1576001.1 phosphopantetheine-binding protein [Crossiella sp. SN42]WHT20628.1 phosphopantetheine-binding protein [Crossiella sp. CA-258035]
MTVEAEIRGLLAEAVELDRATVDALPADTPLFAPEIGLTSLAGLKLLSAIRDRFGVDVADEDMNLDSLESIASLAAFVGTRTRR